MEHWSALFRRKRYTICYWFLWSLVLITAVWLRCWHLGALDRPVFDEVYFPKYGYDYLVGQPFFHVHPPLANYIFAASIWLYAHMPFIDMPPLAQISFEQLPVISYRWINVVGGSGLAVAVWGAFHTLFRQRWAALLLFAFVATDGLYVVDSRFALNNLYVVLFGVLALWSALLACRSRRFARLWLILAGICLGLAAAVKWNGLGFGLLLVIAGGFLLMVRVCERWRPAVKGHHPRLALLPNLPLWEYAVYLLLVPMVVYSLIWVPDRQFNTEYGLVEMHQQMLGYHQGVGGSSEHPYCSRWYDWPVLWQPVGYSFKSRTVHQGGITTTRYKDVHLIANPLLAWAALAALAVMLVHWAVLTRRWFCQGVITRQWLLATTLLAGYISNWLPWALVSRCLFLYHYQSAYLFSLAALAWYLHALLRRCTWLLKGPGVLLLALIAFGWLYWLPIQLGIPLSPEAFYDRMWLESWI